MNQTKLQLSLLGGLTITENETAVSNFASRKVAALLAYLVCNPRPHSREVLATLLWPNNDQTRALANLSVALTSLRKQLDAYLLAERHTICFNVEADFWLDTAVFQQAISQARESQKQRGKLGRASAAQLATAVSLYKGDFLAGFTIRGAPEFEAWALLEQERLRQMLLTALADMATFHQQRGQFDDGIRYAQQLLTVDPLQEEMQRQLMHLYMQNNQRTAALAQYEQCVAILVEELGVEPDEATTALYEQIVGERGGRGKEEKSLPHPRPPAPQHNLPAAVTSFIGREDELKRIEQWLGEPNGRLLTIIGPGGMGKTRLAQEAARAYVSQFGDGVWTISLVPHTDIGGVVTAVAAAIGFTFSGNEKPTAQLVNYLQSQEMLLLLDNMEHLLTPNLLTFVTQLIEQAPDLRLIATSRERLRLQAETLLELRGLPTPQLGKSATDYAAAQLFVDRVQRIQANFKMDEQETAVIQLCQLVGGLPLALELAATWTRVLSVTDIVAEIQRGLDALTSSLHDLPERHHSIRAVIESSWQLLPADEQILFRKLSIFRGGFAREAAQQVANATLSQLMSLVDRSFLRLDADQRFRRHPLLLQFAQEQLSAHPTEQTEARAAHAHFFANFVQTHEPALHGSDAPIALAAIEVDLENIRSAWQYALSPLDAALLDKMVTGIGRFFNDRSRYLEGVEFFESSLTAIKLGGETAVKQQMIAKVQVELGLFWYQNGRFADAEAILKETNELSRQYNLTKTRIACLQNLGDVTEDQGNREAARAYLEEALQLCQTNGDGDQKLPIVNSLGNLYVGIGDYDQARAYFDEAMRLAKASGNTLRVAILHNNIGIIANRQDNYDEAIKQWQLAQQRFKQLHHDVGLANTGFNIAMAYVGLEQYDDAFTNIKEAYAAYEKAGRKQSMAAGLAVMGVIYHRQGKRRQARRYYYDSLLLAQEVGIVWVIMSTFVDIAELEMSYGEMEQAALLLTFAVQHPAIEATTLANAQKLLDELAAELSVELMREVETAVKSHTLESLIAHLVSNH